jgi:DNA primase
MRQVLGLLGFEPTWRREHQLRGACPLPACTSQDREFSVNIERAVFHCFDCGASGNQLDLWAQAHQLTLHQAAKHLCDQTNILVPLLPSTRH